MLLTKIRTYMELMRYIVCLSAFLMAIIGYWLSIHEFDFWNVPAFLAAISVGTALAFGNILNDILDLKADKVNYPDRPLPSGAIPLLEAWWATAFFLAISLLCGFLAGWRMFLFTIFLLSTTIVYDLWTCKIPILGKVIVAAWCALTLATGYFVVEGGDFPIIPILAAFFFILAREFIETISDDVGDKIGGRRSIYLLWGQKRVLQICFALVAGATIMLFIPLFTANLSSPLLYVLTITLLLILPIIMAMVSIWKDQSPMNIRHVAHWVGGVFFSSFVAFLWLV